MTIDVDSATWRDVEKCCEFRIGECHRLLEEVGYGEVETAVLRGEIKALRFVLALKGGEPATHAPSTDYGI